jgi:pSer/pThr/pTyr-binding forkhead associated (FHA) protein
MPSSRSWIIGSAPECDLIIDRPTVSGRHCRLVRDGQGYLLEDLGSANGTFVNDYRLTAPLRVGQSDRITLGTMTSLPWPDDSWGAGTKIVSVGRDPGNDVVIEDSRVSQHHARVILEGGGGPITIEDLGSSNGTSLNVPGQRITRARITESDRVYLGSYELSAARLLGRVPEVAPTGPTELTVRGEVTIVGRDAGCDAVFDLPMVSGRHARLSRWGADVLIEDLGSSNGTFLNGQRVEGRVLARAGDQIGLGSLNLRLAIAEGHQPLPTGLPGSVPIAEPHTPIGGESPWSVAGKPEIDRHAAHAPATGNLAPTVVVRAGGGAGDQRAATTSDTRVTWGLALIPALGLALGLVVTGLAGGVAQRNVTAESWLDRSLQIGDVLFALGLIAIGCGCVSGLGLSGFLPGTARDGPPTWASLGWRLVAGLAGCVVALAVVHGGCALEGPWLGMLAALVLAMLAGMALGATAMHLTHSFWPAVGVLGVAMLGLVLLGGAWPRRPQLPQVLRLAAQAMPSRWAFEGLMILESDHRPTFRSNDQSATQADEPQDMADRFFPAQSERVGLAACLLALIACAAGLAGVGFLIDGVVRPLLREL